MNRDRIIQEFSLRKFGRKGWMGNSSKFICPVCNKSDKIGILFLKEGGAIVNCFHENHYRKGVNQYFRDINRIDLIEQEQESVSSTRQIIDIFEDKKKEEQITKLPIKPLPIGFKPITQDEYLDNRGFLPYHYDLFRPGVTNIDLRQRGNVIFQLFDKGGNRIGWLSRSKKSKEWHKENLILSKEGKAELKLRYDNSPNTDFAKMLGGWQELNDEVKTVILVEGLFDKVNVDIQLDLPNNKEVKCLFTFGDSISIDQINILKQYPNIEDIYLLYDYNTITQSKQYGLDIQSAMRCRVKVGEIKKEGKDPGNMSSDEIIDTLQQSVDPLSFKVGKLEYV